MNTLSSNLRVGALRECVCVCVCVYVMMRDIYSRFLHIVDRGREVERER